MASPPPEPNTRAGFRGSRLFDEPQPVDWEKTAPLPGSATPRHANQASAGSIPPAAGHGGEPLRLHQSHAHQRPLSPWIQNLRNRWRSTWAPELLCCVLGLIWFGATILILQLYNGKPLPQWRFGITLNALVAVFALFVKAGLFIPLTEGLSQMKWESFRKNPKPLSDMELYDSASRDWWGCVRLFFTSQWFDLKTRRIIVPPALAKVAAFTILILTITDPFTQQVLQYQACPQVQVGSTALISKTNFYAQVEEGATLEGADDPVMEGAVIRGLYDPPEDPSSLVSAVCSSGNCTFPLFSTIGFCSKCADVSSYIKTVQDPDAVADDCGDPKLPECASHVILDYAPPSRVDTVTLSLNFSTAEVIESLYMNTSVAGFTASDLHHPFEVSSAAVVEILTTLLAPDGNISSFAAFSCSIDPCVKTYNTSMQSGVLSESIVKTAPIGVGQIQYSLDLWVLATSQVLVDGEWQACQSSTENTTGMIAVSPANVDAAPNFTDFTYTQAPVFYPPECVWRIENELAAGIQAYLDKQLGNLTTGTYFAGFQDIDSNLPAFRLFNNGSATLNTTSTFMQQLTDSMTATVRHSGSLGQTEWAAGQVLYNTTCVDVQWPWLTPLALAVLLTWAFLLLILVHHPPPSKTRAHPPIWKSSSLAVLFSALEDDVAAKVGANSSREDILAAARSVIAQLVEDDQGRTRFRAVREGELGGK